MVKFVLNIPGDNLSVFQEAHGLFDFILLKPKNYNLRLKAECACFFETDFKKGIPPEFLAEQQQNFAQDNDVVIAPDVFAEKDRTLSNFSKWSELMHNQNVLKLFAPQGKTPNEYLDCLNQIERFEPDILGIGYPIISTIFNKENPIEVAIKIWKFARQRKWLTHLLGWSPTILRGKIFLYKNADFLDSQSLFMFLKQYRKSLNSQGKWVDDRRLLVSRFIETTKNLRTLLNEQSLLKAAQVSERQKWSREERQTLIPYVEASP